MKPVLISHATYRDSTLQCLRQHYSDGRFVIVNKDWPLVAKLWMTDLSYITTLLQNSYAAKGPQPRDPASMLRSYLLFLMTKPEVGVTECGKHDPGSMGEAWGKHGGSMGTFFLEAWGRSFCFNIQALKTMF